MGGSSGNGSGSGPVRNDAFKGELNTVLKSGKFPYSMAASVLDEFTGKNPEEYFAKLKIRANIEEWSDTVTVDLARLRLRNDAFDYYMETPELHERNIELKTFVKAFVDKFTKKKVPGQIYHEIANTRQNSGETVLQFANKLKALKKELIRGDDVDGTVAEKLILYQFKTGLNKDIKKYIRVTMDSQATLSFDDAVALAEREELELNRVAFGNLEIGAVSRESYNQRRTRSCYQCGATDHIRRDCRQNEVEVCRRCRKPGHIEIGCRERIIYRNNYSSNSNPTRYRHPPPYRNRDDTQNRFTRNTQYQSNSQHLNGRPLSRAPYRGRN